MCGRGLLFLTIYSSEVFQFFTMSMYFFYIKNKLVQIPVLPPAPYARPGMTHRALGLVPLGRKGQ